MYCTLGYDAMTFLANNLEMFQALARLWRIFEEGRKETAGLRVQFHEAKDHFLPGLGLATMVTVDKIKNGRIYGSVNCFLWVEKGVAEGLIPGVSEPVKKGDTEEVVNWLGEFLLVESVSL